MVKYTYSHKGLSFEWHPSKDYANQAKHGVSFEKAVRVFLDPERIIEKDDKHSDKEHRYHCYGLVEGGVMTVRFTWRENRIRILGAAYWRKGKKKYVEKNTL